MKEPISSPGSRAQIFLAATLLTFLSVLTVRAQPQKPATQQPEDVLRIKTELVQTDLMVFDRQGRFVEGLRPEQFQLSVDGKPQAVTFFELVRTGSAAEAAKLTAKSNASVSPASAPAPNDNGPGRVIFFFLDDLHLREASLIRARKALGEFIENQMGENDRVAIVSTSGQIGFLQQLTDYKPMLRAAAGRLTYKKNMETYAGKVPITDYQAIQVADHNDRDLFVYLLLATMNEYQSQGPLVRVAANMVRNRVRQISTQTRIVTSDTLGVLESLMQSSSSLPGRKLVFFISDGFMTDTRGSGNMALLKRVTDVAARSGVVVYTMDARGTFNDAIVDAGRNDFPDGMATGTQAQHPSMENAAMQEPLHILADDTGGRAILNSNSFKDAFQQAIDETSTYYLLGWRPGNDNDRSGLAKIKVSIKERPELRVRLRNNYYSPPPRENQEEGTDAAEAKEEHTPEVELLTTLGSLYPQKTIPTALAVGYVNTAEQGLTLKASMQIERAALTLANDEKAKTLIDVIGAAIDDRGIIVTFKQVVTVTADPSLPNQPIVWNQQLKLQPGLYQVRVAIRQRETGRTGSAQQWIEVPDVAKGGLQISSLFLGERRMISAEDPAPTSARPVAIDVDRRFPRTSVLRFQTYVYNATNGAASPDVEIQARVMRGERPIVSMAPAKLPTDTTKDKTRLPYWAEIPLGQLSTGRYELFVTATDRSTRSSVSQHTTFFVE